MKVARYEVPGIERESVRPGRDDRPPAQKSQGAPGKRWRAPWVHRRGVRLCSCLRPGLDLPSLAGALLCIFYIRCGMHERSGIERFEL
ncbi:MAG: hypothetical protein QOH31_5592 [Verrucomicrobiota bacterium]|jgi:hypothetical protein